MAQGDRALMVAPVEWIDRLEREQGLTLHRIAELPYFNEAGIRVRTLLWPDRRATSPGGAGREPVAFGRTTLRSPRCGGRSSVGHLALTGHNLFRPRFCAPVSSTVLALHLHAQA